MLIWQAGQVSRAKHRESHNEAGRVSKARFDGSTLSVEGEDDRAENDRRLSSTAVAYEDDREDSVRKGWASALPTSRSTGSAQTSNDE